MDSQDRLSEDCFTKVSFIALAARKARVNARLLDPKWSVILGRGFRVRGGPATAVIGFLSTPSGFCPAGYRAAEAVITKPRRRIIEVDRLP